jgi:hypothetical protein
MRSRYPVQLGDLRLSAAEYAELDELANSLSSAINLGDLDAVGFTYLASGTDCISALRDVSVANHFKVTSCTGPYPDESYLAGTGSVAMHSDSGLGLVAVSLLGTAPLPGGEFADEACHLITTGGGYVVMRQGDVVVFNAEAPHAWMANCRWLLASVCVSRPRRKRTTANTFLSLTHLELNG